MATLLLHKNRALRALALLLAVALLVSVRGAQTSYATSASKVQWLFAGTCGQAFGPTASYALKANGTQIASFVTDNQCTCNQPIVDITITDPGLLAAAGQGCADWRMVQTNTAYVSWSKVKVTRPGGNNESICLVDNSGRNCTVEDTNVCNGLSYVSNGTFAAPVPDMDSDSQSDCVDSDIDGDGVANTVDNCPVNSNAAQTDTDHNGKGDACDPPDLDNDGILNINDNCVYTPNVNQLDANGNGTGDVCEVEGVVAVPWLGSEQLPHQVYSGGSIVLQAVATKKNTPGVGAELTSATWDPGDGSPVENVPFTNGLKLELEHIYTGSVGQPFTATITVTDGGGNVMTDTFKVVIASNSRETKVNMAIDRGLWNLHKNTQRGNVDGVPSANWSGSYNLAATASAVQAFEINNHRESGDPAHDPYVDNVARGLRNLLSSGNMQKLATFGLQNSNNPDGNSNGFGLWVNNNDHSSYIGGQVIDAIVASGTPNAIAVSGIDPGVKGRAYKDIVQDLLDGYSWGMGDDRGGWFYGFNGTSGSNDTSASHWWAIGVLAAHTWNLDAPAWVRSIQLNTGIPLMQDYTPNTVCAHTANGANGSNLNDGHFGYTDSKNWLWDNGTNTTAAGLVLLNADGVAQTNARFTCASQFLADRYNTSMGNFYTMYQLTKAMRTAFDGSGQTAPITNLNGTIDWYAGYADYLVANQSGAGSFSSNGSTGVGADLASAWAIIILSPSLFELPPSAACSVTPATIGKFGGTVTFNASASFHPDPSATITGYAWNFDDGTPAGSGVSTSHNYAVPASFPTTRNATVTVTDSNGNSATASCPVTIVNNNVPPAVTIAGPYTVCKGSPLTLVGQATDEDGSITATAWDLISPINFASIDAVGTSVDATAIFANAAVGTYNIGFRATDDNSASSSVFSSVTVIPANDPSCNQPPVAVDDTASTLSGTPVTITVLANDTDGDQNTLTVTSTTSAANGSVVVNGDGTVTYTPSLGFAGTDTFTYTISDGHGGEATATVTVTVTKRQATVIADGGTKVFGTADPAIGATSSGFLAADNIAVSYTGRDAGENVGSYATHATASGAALANYAVTNTDGVFTITQADSTAAATGGAFTYDGAAHAGSCAFAGVNGEVLNGTLTYSSGAAPVAAGSYTVTCDFAGNANYNASSATATITIAKADATCAVTGYSVTYDTAAHTATGSCTGVNGEALAGLDLSASTHTNAASYSDAWAFTDVTGNYNNTSGAVADVILKAPTKTTLAISTGLAAAGAPVTLTATVISIPPGAGTPNGTVTFTEGATVIGTATLNASGIATLTTTTLSNGPHTITATYNESQNYLSSTSNTVTTLIYGYPVGGGTFVIADKVATMGATVNFWGSQWEKNNIPSGGASNASFKGFAVSPTPPTVGATFTAAPGNSAPSPAAVPQYLGVIVTSKVTKSGSNITGTIVKLVVVKVAPGYAGNPGNAGNGTIVAVIQ